MNDLLQFIAEKMNKFEIDLYKMITFAFASISQNFI